MRVESNSVNSQPGDSMRIQNFLSVWRKSTPGSEQTSHQWRVRSCLMSRGIALVVAGSCFRKNLRALSAVQTQSERDRRRTSLRQRLEIFFQDERIHAV